MLKQKLTDNWQWTGLWLVLILSSIYSKPIIPIDETRYLSVAWEMWQNNEFLVPSINGHPYSHKPPLLFWLIHFSWLLFGVGEWSGRLVGPLFGFGSIFLTVRLAKLLWPENKDVSVTVPFILLGTLSWGIYSSLTMFDALLTFWSLLALLLVLEARKNKTLFPWFSLSVVIGLGILSKGPIVLFYVLPSLFLAPVWSKRGGLSWGKWYWFSFLSLAAGVSIALCWALPAAKAGGEEYQQAILFSQTTGRMVKAFAHGRPFYWYVLLLPLLCFPWIFWIPAWRSWKKIYFDHSTHFCLCTILPAFFLLSCVSGKQMHYILPILPLVALLIARAVTSVPQRTRFDRVPLLLIYIIATIALLVVPQLSLQGGDREMLKYIPEWIAVIPFVCGLYVYLLRSNSVLKSIKVVSSSTLMMLIFLQLAIAKPLHVIYDQSAIGEKMREVQGQGGQIAVFPPSLSKQFQFSGRLTRPLLSIKSLDELAIWSLDNQQQSCLLFIKDRDYKLLKGAGIARKYTNGWLIFCDTKDFMPSYRNWSIAQSIGPKVVSNKAIISYD